MAYGATPSPPGLLGSSPSTRSSVIPIARSYKRTSSVGSASSVPDSFQNPCRIDEFARKFSFGVSCRSSPTDALPPTACCTTRTVSQGQTVTYGFNPEVPQFDMLPVMNERVRPQVGLLSRAFSSDSLSCGEGSVTGCMQDRASLAYHAAQSLEEHWHAPDQYELDLKGLPAVFSTKVVKMAYHIACLARAQQQGEHGQYTLSGLEQSLETARILAGLGLSSEMVAAGLLHNVLDDTTMSKYQLQEYMPSEVVDVVVNSQRMGSISQLYRQHAESINPDSLVDMFTAMSSVQSVIVKLADRLQIMRNIGSVASRVEQIRVAREAQQIYCPLANRLGLWCMKAELEDLSFQILEPHAYKKLKDQVMERQKQGFLEHVVKVLKEKVEARGIRVADISGRPKNLWGIYQKLKNKDNASLDQVFDVYAIRVITHTKEDCYIARDLACSVWQHIPGRSKDFIRNKKDNGYQSLHETVLDEQGLPFEVQIRTHKMHFMAEYGMSAHWQYKENSQCKAEKCEHMHSLIKWNRWLTAFKMRVYDKKVRPLGSPPMDVSLASLGVEYLDSSEEKVDPLLRNERFRLKPVYEEGQNLPVNVVVLSSDHSMRVQQFPAGTTVAGVASMLRNEVGSLFNPVVRVNGQDVSPLNFNQILQNGDQVMLVSASDMCMSSRYQGFPQLHTSYPAARAFASAS